MNELEFCLPKQNFPHLVSTNEHHPIILGFHRLHLAQLLYGAALVFESVKFGGAVSDVPIFNGGVCAA